MARLQEVLRAEVVDLGALRTVLARSDRQFVANWGIDWYMRRLSFWPPQPEVLYALLNHTEDAGEEFKMYWASEAALLRDLDSFYVFVDFGLDRARLYDRVYDKVVYRQDRAEGRAALDYLLRSGVTPRNVPFSDTVVAQERRETELGLEGVFDESELVNLIGDYVCVRPNRKRPRKD